MLLVLSGPDESAAFKSFRNLAGVTVLAADDCGVADLVGAASVVFSQSALDSVTSRARAKTTAAFAAGPRDRAPGGDRLMDAGQVIIRPVVSEKSYALATIGKYTFRVHQNAHKTQIKQAIEELFDVAVLDVRTSSVPSKPKRRGYTAGRTRAWKKAVIQVREGDTIPIFQGLEGEL